MNLNTSVTFDGKIIQELADDKGKLIFKSLLDSRDIQVKKSLLDLGWKPLVEWIPIDEFYKLNFAGYVWMSDGAVVDLTYFNGEIFHELECDRYPHRLTPITKVIPIPEPKP